MKMFSWGFVMKARYFSAVLSIFAATTQANAVPVKAGDGLHYLTTADSNQIDAGAYCEAKIDGKSVYLVDIAANRGVIRYDNKRYFLLSEAKSKFIYEASHDFDHEIVNDTLPPFGIEIQKIPGSRSTQTEEGTTTAAKMVIRAGNGAAWGTYTVLWTCGA